MMPIGSRPVLWHVMRYYAHFGHTEFILCLGYGAQAVKDYFLDYRETASNDFVLTKGGEHVELLEHRHQRLDDHVHRHRHRHRDRRAAAPGAALPRGRRGVPRQLRRRADRRADERPHRRVPRHRRGRRSSSRSSPQDSFHVVDIGRRRPGHGPRAASPTCRCASTAATSCCARASSTTSTRATTWSWTAASGPRATADAGRAVRRVLGADGHPEGAHRPRGAVPPRHQPLGAVAGPAVDSGGRSPGWTWPSPPTTGSPDRTAILRRGRRTSCALVVGATTTYDVPRDVIRPGCSWHQFV